MSLVLSNPVWVEETTDIVLKMLEDERLEVREKAAEVLGGLLHCDFITDTEKLLVSLII
jgi:proteasome activator subunit 4